MYWGYFIPLSCCHKPRHINHKHPACHLPRAYLKKSFLQYSLPSREKHFSVKLHLHSQHCTHLTCQALSSTLSRKRSRIGLSQPAQWTMALGWAATPQLKHESELKSTVVAYRPSMDRESASSFTEKQTRPLLQVKKKPKGEKNQSFIGSGGKTHNSTNM